MSETTKQSEPDLRDSIRYVPGAMYDALEALTGRLHARLAKAERKNQEMDELTVEALRLRDRLARAERQLAEVTATKDEYVLIADQRLRLYHEVKHVWREKYEALERELGEAAAREAALREALQRPPDPTYRSEPFDDGESAPLPMSWICNICGRSVWGLSVGSIAIRHTESCLPLRKLAALESVLSSPSPAAAKLLRVVEAARAWVAKPARLPILDEECELREAVREWEDRDER